MVLSLLAALALSQTVTQCEVYDQGCIIGWGCTNGVLSCKGSWDAPSTCSAGQFVTAIDGGSVTCATPTSSSPSVTPSTPLRTFNSNFQPSTTKATFVSYSVSLSCTANLSGGQSSTVELRSDSGSTPSTVRATAANANSVALAIALTVVNAQTVQLSAVVPAGHYVRLNSTGTCTVTLVSQEEVTFD